MLNSNQPLSALLLLLRGRLQHAQRSERGASAVEWVVIAAIVVGICIAVGLVIQNALEGKAGDISDEIGNS
jgi:Flp pilus assembly pilin Flp